MIPALRWVSLLLITVLVAGRIHLCEPSYELPSGETCFICPSIGHDSRVQTSSPTATLSSDHGDCHDCCELRACDDHGKVRHSPSLIPGFDAPVCLIEPPELVPPSTGKFVTQIPYSAAAPPTGPPSRPSTRAPPRPTSHLPSAGTGTVNLA